MTGHVNLLTPPMETANGDNFGSTESVAADKVDFYEGTEKLLEIWFTCATPSTGITTRNHDSDKVARTQSGVLAKHKPEKQLHQLLNGKNMISAAAATAVVKPADLRSIPSEDLDMLLSHVNATIISTMSTPDTDAYVLSESSMFISSRCFILKTCGSTTLIKAIRPLIQLVHKYTSFTAIEDLFYSRKDFLRPELQDDLHSSFSNEVKFLDQDFDGHAYCLGRLNDQCWYLYCLNQRASSKIQEPDQSLEIMMEQLDPQVMEIFTRPTCTTAAEATEKSGIDTIIPGMIIDDFLFDPCGYSMNGLLPTGHYATIHITPQAAYSYVSFETNVPPSHYSYPDIIKRVLDVFRPGKFLFTLYSTKKSQLRNTHVDLEEHVDFEEFKKMDVQTYSLRNYLLSYLSYVRDIT